MEGFIWPRERRKNKQEVGKEMRRDKREEEEERQEEDWQGKED